VHFPKSLDQGLLQRLIWVVAADGRRVPGSIHVGPSEKSWEFIPAKPWAAGKYRIVIDTTLEDPSGNSIARPFELDLVQPRPEEKPQLVELPFEVK